MEINIENKPLPIPTPGQVVKLKHDNGKYTLILVAGIESGHLIDGFVLESDQVSVADGEPMYIKGERYTTWSVRSISNIYDVVNLGLKEL